MLKEIAVKDTKGKIVRKRFQTFTEGKSMTRQSEKESTDINNIVARFERGEVVSHFNKHGGSYGEVSGLDFHSAMNTIVKAQNMFDDLPASVRTRFGNDPQQFLDFVQDAKNIPEMQKMGLAKGTPENPANPPLTNPEPVAAPTTNPPKAESDANPSGNQ
mgnify:CR=1 FL=1